ncbi:energy transducer TonB [Pedobacter gandavensis]|uniref:energy transducer TonB n=1 Tax=Pedobacter gandavensis TaxID=2679963 RepID=UPI00292F9EFC|nr:energy transducer TonB [Pedobacter gandavensis]
MKTRTKLILHLISSIILTLSVFTVQAQTKLYGSYVATKISYLSDDELPEDNILKYTYTKYTFSNSDRISSSGVYSEIGTNFLFAIEGNRLIIKSEAGAVINTMKIMESTANKLVLVSSASNGSLEDPWAIKYTLYNEQFLQSKLPLTPDDIFSIKGTDTLYKSGQKIYAQFQGPSFQQYMYEQLGKKKMNIRNGQLLSTFIIDKNGHPDSLRIIQGINPKFDAEYIKAFNSSKNKWQPAKLNNENVKVLMSQELKYLSTEEGIPTYFLSQKANKAYKDKDYELALYYYDKALELKNDDIVNLYRRGICRQVLGNLKGACADWIKIQALGNPTANELLLKYCK